MTLELSMLGDFCIEAHVFSVGILENPEHVPGFDNLATPIPYLPILSCRHRKGAAALAVSDVRV